MSEWFTSLADSWAPGQAMPVIKAVLLVVAGFLIAKIVGATFTRLFREHLSKHQLVLIKRIVFYTILILFLVSALRELGFKLTVLLGAAGILTVAIGFASQTSASNVISGLFLLGERPFSMGDIVKINDFTGEVLSIDLLSVKLRTFDNLYVRIPNETVIKASVTTLSKFPIRRVDLQIGVAYKEDIAQVRKVLFDLADKNPLCLDEPKPLLMFQGFGDSAINLQFSVWTKRENLLELKNNLQIDIKQTFDDLGIEIPFPHHSIYTGSVTDPFPVKIVSDSEKKKSHSRDYDDRQQG